MLSAFFGIKISDDFSRSIPHALYISLINSTAVSLSIANHGFSFSHMPPLG
jgi:hypothetical protein